jgi:hypothetical protein
VLTFFPIEKLRFFISYNRSCAYVFSILGEKFCSCTFYFNPWSEVHVLKLCSILTFNLPALYFVYLIFIRSSVLSHNLKRKKSKMLNQCNSIKKKKWVYIIKCRIDTYPSMPTCLWTSWNVSVRITGSIDYSRVPLSEIPNIALLPKQLNTRKNLISLRAHRQWKQTTQRNKWTVSGNFKLV